MVLLKVGGRVGNQIFQYAFFKTKFSTPQKLILFEGEELLSLFDLEDDVFLLKRQILFKGSPFLFWHSIKYVFKFLSFLKLFNYYEEKEIGYFYKKGLMKNISIINYGNFQSEKFFSPKIKEKLKIKSEFLDKAKDILKSFNDKELVFVHIRRGDYVNLGWSLPKSYYEKGIKYFQNKLNDPYFIFLSDDIEWVKENFKLNNAYYSNNDLYVDFTLMTLCEYGIMSNSTFSYWGGYLMQNRKEVISPKYWLGFKEKRYSPIGIKPSWTKEIEVDY